jgi:hypothetical protein
MARRDQSNARKLELLSQLTIHRRDITAKKQVLAQQISESTQQLKDTINIPKLIGNKIKSSFTNSPTKWFIGFTLGGLLISKFVFGLKATIFKTSKEIEKTASKGIFYTLAAMAARPLIKSFFIGKAKDYVTQRFLRQPQSNQYDYQDEHEYYHR